MDLHEAIEAIELEEYLDAEGLDYKRVGNGDNLALRECPWCGDSRWRVYFSRPKRRGICFQADCPKGRFNLFSFARQVTGGDNASTARHLVAFAEGAGPVRRRPAAPVCTAVTPSLVLPDSVELPAPGTPADGYLAARRVTPASQRLFGLRWCDSGIWTYADVNGKACRMSFGGRVILPVHDLDGTPVTFQGRDVTGGSELRYLFPPSLPSSGRFLYGAHLARGARHLVVGEGPFDAIAIHQAMDHPDFRDCAALATFGLSLGQADGSGADQLGALLRLRAEGAGRVTILWDAEAGAIRRALEVAALLRRHAFQVAIGILPPGRDPAEVDTRVVREAISGATPFTPALGVRWAIAPPVR